MKIAPKHATAYPIGAIHCSEPANVCLDIKEPIVRNRVKQTNGAPIAEGIAHAKMAGLVIVSTARARVCPDLSEIIARKWRLKVLQPIIKVCTCR